MCIITVCFLPNQCVFFVFVLMMQKKKWKCLIKYLSDYMWPIVLNVLLLIKKTKQIERLRTRNKDSKFCSKNCIKRWITSKQTRNRNTLRCCRTIFSTTLTAINIHEAATLQTLRIVKLIMLTGSFNCFIQSKAILVQ